MEESRYGIQLSYAGAQLTYQAPNVTDYHLPMSRV